MEQWFGIPESSFGEHLHSVNESEGDTMESRVTSSFLYILLNNNCFYLFQEVRGRFSDKKDELQYFLFLSQVQCD